MHIAEENHLSDFQAHFLKEHAQCGKREVFLEFSIALRKMICAISSIETTLHLILATLRHPQLTTLLNLQLRQKVFLRVPISVVGTGRVHSRLPLPRPFTLTEARGCKGFASPSAKKAARTEATSTEVACLPACPGGVAAASAPCRHGVGPALSMCYTHARWYVGSKPPVQAF
ncbi:hypothetical protein PAPYR_11989 [Paratrimastix pyriformis]|uniref:Uncharacterized protein n=1 Tax=Paratrimastix pyriformis TaxID=342808 RepID=A0ABQ8U6D4_9EUKA|nr:hypothetical protein PAPYR_11989 [Paratrimastix pyriformis]